jgi:hypothetical protein
MAKARMRLEWDQTSALWSLLANAYRDTSKKPTPFMPQDIHPLADRTDARDDDNDEPDWAMIEQIRRNHKVTTLNGRQLD